MNQKMTDTELEEAGINETERRLLAHIAALEAERDEAHGARDDAQRLYAADIERVAGERDALRERVTALEGETVELNDAVREQSRQRSEAERKWHASAEAATLTESRLAAIRRRAETWRTTGRLGDESRAALEFVLEVDAPAPSEPTTAEAFAMLRAVAEKWVKPEHPDRQTALSEVSLLERRMGAMGTLIREAIMGDRYVRKAWLERAQTALTGAPPVFTLAEVRAALVAELESPGNCGVSYVDCCAAACDGLVKRLENLRR